ncbi:MAG: hypothetical protein D6734_03115 [Candidatus Schekmanbacteria bacterium]|nr:MAG: hypothetical protein D6734_03115 [Candidatus Schekmanbacteria bacterium]
MFKKITKSLLVIFLSLLIVNTAEAKKKKLIIKSSSSNIKVGENETFKAKIKPPGKNYKNVEWTISGISGIDNGIIDESGVYTAPSVITYTKIITDRMDTNEYITSTVTAKAIDVIIKAKSKKAGIKNATKKITVYDPPAVLDVSLKPAKFTIVVKKKQKLSLNVKKKGSGASSDISWHFFVGGKSAENEVFDGSAGKIVKKGKKFYYKAPSKKENKTVYIVARSELDKTRYASAKAVVMKTKPKLLVSGISPIVDFGTVKIGEDVTGRERTFSLISSTGEGVEWQVTNIPTWIAVEPLRDKTPSNVLIRISSTSSLRPGFNQGVIVFKSQKTGYKKAKLKVFINATE